MNDKVIFIENDNVNVWSRDHYKNRKRVLIILILFIFVNSTVFGTFQTPDRIIYNGKEYLLFSYPLESFFSQYPDKRPKTEIISTALWRGYVATFEMKDNQLYLIDIKIQISTKDGEGNHNSSWKSVLNDVFPNLEVVKVDWMTGLLKFSTERYASASLYDYTLLEIDNGNLKKVIYSEIGKLKSIDVAKIPHINSKLLICK
jgi:hypothetical protein